jgi:hypothetical protein
MISTPALTPPPAETPLTGADLTSAKPALIRAIIAWLARIDTFSQKVTQIPLRPYQTEPARAILKSILAGRGLQFAVMMCRQAGKNELSAQLEAYLLNLYQRAGGGIVKASPTFKPQTVNSILRLCDRLNNPWNAHSYRRREGYIVEMGRARCFFFSADPHSSVVGGTANILLECDEAQDVEETKWDKDFEPMTASTNATRVFYGTAWTSDTLLAKTIAHLRTLEKADGQRRVFTYDADQVAQSVPTYAEHVRDRIAKLGRQHPLIRTQYYLETIDQSGGLFNAMRYQLMHGDHNRRHAPISGRKHALLIDVGGEDEAEGDGITRQLLENPKRDATALTVVEAQVTSPFGFPGQLPTYLVRDRQLWIGTKHTALQDQIIALANHWHAVWVLIDATGVGAGLASFLAKALGAAVIPVVFSPKTKSDLGWKFIGVVESGRYHDYVDDLATETRQFWHEVERCQYAVRPGPGHMLSWGVQDSPAYDGIIAHGHDDLLVSAAMCALLDDLDWPITGHSAVVTLPDTIEEIDKAEW